MDPWPFVVEDVVASMAEAEAMHGKLAAGATAELKGSLMRKVNAVRSDLEALDDALASIDAHRRKYSATDAELAATLGRKLGGTALMISK